MVLRFWKPRLWRRSEACAIGATSEGGRGIPPSPQITEGVFAAPFDFKLNQLTISPRP